MLALGATARTDTAQAYIGQSLVEATGGKLTNAAEKVLKTGKTIPELVTSARSFSGTAGASRAAAVLQAGKLLPSLSALAAFGVGVGVGSEICYQLGIEGCWFHGSEVADPAIGETAQIWQYRTVPTCAGTNCVPAYTWVAGNGTTYDVLLQGWNEANLPAGVHSCGGVPANGASGLAKHEPFDGSTCKASDGKSYSAWRGVLFRNSMENRVMEYHATDNPSIPNSGYTVPSNWPETMVKAINEGGAAGEKVGEYIASEIPGSGVKSPYKTYVDIPSCDEVTWGACKAVLEEKGLEPIREDLDWTEVTTDVPAQVQTLTPPAGTEVEAPSKVTVVTNPDEAGMPLVIPSPESGETYEHYAARLNPGLTPERQDLEAAFVNPDFGPNAVVSVSPEPETKLDPMLTHKVNVMTNPASAPVPPAGGWEPPDIGGIDLSPLQGVPSPCGVFPFGVLCWFGAAMAEIDVTPECPTWDMKLPWSEDQAFNLCVEPAEQILPYVRILELFIFTIGCGFVFARATRAVGAD